MNVWHIWGLTYDYIYTCAYPVCSLDKACLYHLFCAAPGFQGQAEALLVLGPVRMWNQRQEGTCLLEYCRLCDMISCTFICYLYDDLLYQSGAGWHHHVHRIVHGSGFNQSLSPAWGTQDVPFDIRHLYSFSAKWFWNSVGCWNMYNYFREGVIVGVVWYKIYIYI